MRLIVLLLAALLVAGPAPAQFARNVTAETVNVDGSSFAYSALPAPSGCVAGSVALFLGSPVAMGCDSRLTFSSGWLRAAGGVYTDAGGVMQADAFAGLTNTSRLEIGEIRASGQNYILFKDSSNSFNAGLKIPSTGWFQWGGEHAASPQIVTFLFAGCTAFDTNCAGQTTTFEASRGTGTGAAGAFDFKVPRTTTSGTDLHTRYRSFYTSGSASGVFATFAAGSDVASAATITPTGNVFRVSGTTTISTINLPFTGFVGPLVLIPTALWSTNTAGNIGLATTAVVGKALILHYNATAAKWYPSY